MTIQSQVRTVRPVSSDHDIRQRSGPVLYLDTMSTRDRVRAVLDSGEYQGHWRVIGLHDGRYIVRMADGSTEAMTERQVLDWPLQQFINSRNA